MGAAVREEEAATELPAPTSLLERIVFAILKTTATIAAFNGLSMLVSALPLLAYAQADGRAAAISGALLRLAFAGTVTGLAARHLTSSRKALLPNERRVSPQAGALGGWLLWLAAALWILPPAALYELAPLKALWTDMIDVLRRNDMLEGLMQPQPSGLVFLPIVATLTVPLLQFATAAAFVGSSALLLPLLASRSVRFPRAYLVCVLLQAGLTFASVCGAAIAGDVGQWVSDEAGRSATHTRTMETVQILEAVRRYNDVLRSTGVSLATIFAGYAVWLVPLLASRRAHETFASASSVRDAAAAAAAVAVEGMPRDARRRFYENAARTLQSPATANGGLDAKTLAIAAVAAMAGVALLGLSALRVFSQAGMLRPD